MSTDPSLSPEATEGAEPSPSTGQNGGISSAVRQRLQRVFEHANKCLEKNDYIYAHDLYSQCVTEDPGALAYLQHFRANLAQMHPTGGKKVGSFGSSFSSRGVVAKAAAKGDWTEAFTAGCKSLKKIAQRYPDSL